MLLAGSSVLILRFVKWDEFQGLGFQSPINLAEKLAAMGRAVWASGPPDVECFGKGAPSPKKNG